MAFTFGSAARAEDNSTSFAPLPAGEYDFQIDKVALNSYKGSAKIKPCMQLDLTLRIDLDGGRTQRVWDTIYLDGTHSYSMQKLKHLDQSCGTHIPASADEYRIADMLKDAIGKAEVYIDTYNGKHRNKVRDYVVKELDITKEDLPF